MPYVRLLLDVALLVLLLACLGFRLTEQTTHEWLGLLFLLLSGMHMWCNRKWFFALFKGRYVLPRIAQTAVILALLAAMLFLAAGGLVNSNLLKLLNLSGGMRYREWHTLAAYWGLVLVGIHTGLHWSKIKGMAGWSTVQRALPSSVAKLLRMAVLVLLVLGIWAFFDREMGAKLLWGAGFDYWDAQRPVMLFYLFNLSLFVLYASLSRSCMNILRSLPTASKKHV